MVDSSFVIERSIGISLIPLILVPITLVIHIAFAVAIFWDASERRAIGRVVWFVHPIFWAAATLVGSVFVAAVYWAMHYSTLAPPEKPPGGELNES